METSFYCNPKTLTDTVNDYLQSLFVCLKEQYGYILLPYHRCEVSAFFLNVYFVIDQNSTIYPIWESFKLTELKNMLSDLFSLSLSDINFYVEQDEHSRRYMLNYYSGTVIAFNTQPITHKLTHSRTVIAFNRDY